MYDARIIKLENIINAENLKEQYRDSNYRSDIVCPPNSGIVLKW